MNRKLKLVMMSGLDAREVELVKIESFPYSTSYEVKVANAIPFRFVYDHCSREKQNLEEAQEAWEREFDNLCQLYLEYFEQGKADIHLNHCYKDTYYRSEWVPQNHLVVRVVEVRPDGGVFTHSTSVHDSVLEDCVDFRRPEIPTEELLELCCLIA